MFNCKKKKLILILQQFAIDDNLSVDIQFYCTVLIPTYCVIMILANSWSLDGVTCKLSRSVDSLRSRTFCLHFSELM